LGSGGETLSIRSIADYPGRRTVGDVNQKKEARQSRLRGGLQVLLIGSVSAGVGFAIGHIVTAFVG